MGITSGDGKRVIRKELITMEDEKETETNFFEKGGIGVWSAAVMALSTAGVGYERNLSRKPAKTRRYQLSCCRGDSGEQRCDCSNRYYNCGQMSLI